MLIRRRNGLKLGVEESIQITLVEYIELVHPSVFQYVIKINNEGKRSKAGTYVLKKMGLHPGASDLFIAWPSYGKPGLWLEIKPDDFKINASNKEHVQRQQTFIERMRDVGYVAHMGYGFEQCRVIVDNYLHKGV